MTEQEQYDELLKIEDKLLTFNQFNEVTLEVTDFDILKKLYAVYYNKYTSFNSTCSSCVRELLNICISRYSALKKQFDKVTPPVEVPSTDFKEALRDAKVEADKLTAKMNVESDIKKVTKKKK